LRPRRWAIAELTDDPPWTQSAPEDDFRRLMLDAPTAVLRTDPAGVVADVRDMLGL
jgi:hypothetical protein